MTEVLESEIYNNTKIYTGNVIADIPLYQRKIAKYKNDLSEHKSIFTPLKNSTTTVQGYLDSISFNESKLIEEFGIVDDTSNIKAIECNYGCLYFSGYTIDAQKFKIKRINNAAKAKNNHPGLGIAFNSQITFTVESENTLYKIKVFRSGTLHIPGSKHPNMYDVINPVTEVINYLKVYMQCDNGFSFKNSIKHKLPLYEAYYNILASNNYTATVDLHPNIINCLINVKVNTKDDPTLTEKVNRLCKNSYLYHMNFVYYHLCAYREKSNEFNKVINNIMKTFVTFTDFANLCNNMSNIKLSYLKPLMRNYKWNLINPKLRLNIDHLDALLTNFKNTNNYSVLETNPNIKKIIDVYLSNTNDINLSETIMQSDKGFILNCKFIRPIIDISSIEYDEDNYPKKSKNKIISGNLIYKFDRKVTVKFHKTGKINIDGCSNFNEIEEIYHWFHLLFHNNTDLLVDPDSIVNDPDSSDNGFESIYDSDSSLG